MRFRSSTVHFLLLGGMVLTLSTALSSCIDDAAPRESLPEATAKGLSTGGFLLDGVVWVALQQQIFSPDRVKASVYPAWDGKPGYQLTVTLVRSPAEKGYSNPATYLELFVPSIVGPGRVELGQSVPTSIPSDWPAYGSYKAPDNYPATVPYSAYYTGRGPDSTGELLISRFDTVARVVSGTFHFKALSGKGQINLTAGRFDAKF